MASSSYTSLCSSPSLPTRIFQATRHSPFLCCLLKLNRTDIHPSLSSFSNFSIARMPKPSVLVAKASKSDTRTSKSQGEEDENKFEEYEVELVQPYGLKFTKGRDGGTYIDAIAPGGSADKTGMFSVGDKVIATSAVFGDEGLQLNMEEQCTPSDRGLAHCS